MCAHRNVWLERARYSCGCGSEKVLQVVMVNGELRNLTRDPLPAWLRAPAVDVHSTPIVNCSNDTAIEGLIVSASVARFRRTAHIVAHAGFQPVRMPAIFVRPNESSCKGQEGHRRAMRNAWAHINTSGRRMCVFEDDIVPYPEGPSLLKRLRVHNYADYLRRFPQHGLCGGARYVNQALDANIRLDVLFISGAGYWRNHAQCITPEGAATLLEFTRDCHGKYALRDRESVDIPMYCACLRGERAWRRRACLSGNASSPLQRKLCARSHERDWLNCLRGETLFVQDRMNLKSYLHCNSGHCLEPEAEVLLASATTQMPRPRSL